MVQGGNFSKCLIHFYWAYKRDFFSKISAFQVIGLWHFDKVTIFIQKYCKKKKIRKIEIFRALCFFIDRFQNCVFDFVHNFLSHEASEVPEILTFKRLTNLKYNEDRFSIFALLHFLWLLKKCFFQILKMKISTISTHRTMKFWQGEYFYIKKI